MEIKKEICVICRRNHKTDDCDNLKHKCTICGLNGHIALGCTKYLQPNNNNGQRNIIQNPLWQTNWVGPVRERSRNHYGINPYKEPRREYKEIITNRENDRRIQEKRQQDYNIWKNNERKQQEEYKRQQGMRYQMQQETNRRQQEEKYLIQREIYNKQQKEDYEWREQKNNQAQKEKIIKQQQEENYNKQLKGIIMKILEEERVYNEQQQQIAEYQQKGLTEQNSKNINQKQKDVREWKEKNNCLNCNEQGHRENQCARPRENKRKVMKNKMTQTETMEIKLTQEKEIKPKQQRNQNERRQYAWQQKGDKDKKPAEIEETIRKEEREQYNYEDYDIYTDQQQKTTRVNDDTESTTSTSEMEDNRRLQDKTQFKARTIIVNKEKKKKRMKRLIPPIQLGKGVNCIMERALIDSGAERSLVSNEIAEKLIKNKQATQISKEKKRLMGLAGTIIYSLGTIEVDIKFETGYKIKKVKLLIIKGGTCTENVLLGTDTIQNYNLVPNIAMNTLYIQTEDKAMTAITKTKKKNQDIYIMSTQIIKIEPSEYKRIKVKINTPNILNIKRLGKYKQMKTNKYQIIEGIEEYKEEKEMTIDIVNNTRRKIKIKKEENIAIWEPLNKFNEMLIEELDNEKQRRTTGTGKNEESIIKRINKLNLTKEKNKRRNSSTELSRAGEEIKAKIKEMQGY